MGGDRAGIVRAEAAQATQADFPSLKVIKLQQNYRSSVTILQAANAVIKNNARRRTERTPILK